MVACILCYEVCFDLFLLCDTYFVPAASSSDSTDSAGFSAAKFFSGSVLSHITCSGWQALPYWWCCWNGQCLHFMSWSSSHSVLFCCTYVVVAAAAAASFDATDSGWCGHDCETDTSTIPCSGNWSRHIWLCSGAQFCYQPRCQVWPYLHDQPLVHLFEIMLESPVFLETWRSAYTLHHQEFYA